MRQLYNVLTVLFWITVIIACLMLVRAFSNAPNFSQSNNSGLTIGYAFGSILGAGIVPAIIWVIRYFVGKGNK